MPKIHKLSYHEAQKIAAGEVVERPANVVKELLENSIDAGATSVTLYIEDGGKKLIRIVDNGCGMAVDDAHLCFEHHATSKITSVDDLVSIDTFGFRGEALSSIASVSRVTLITNDNPANSGTKLVREGNVLFSEQPCAAPRGTDFTVQDLFYNVPARLKFLKKRETEFNQIHALFQAYCLAYPHLHWRFFSEDSELHNCAPTDTIEQRVAQLFDTRFTSALIPCTYTNKDNSLKIIGVITDNTYARYDRSDLFFFVNQRWIKNQPLSRALLKGYGNTLPPGRFPAAALFITVNQNEVDINVHPRKEEVLFLHPKVVENALFSLVSDALERKLSMRLQQVAQAHHTPTNNFTYTFQSSTPNKQDFSVHTQKESFSSTTLGLHSPETVFQSYHEPLFFGSSEPQRPADHISSMSAEPIQQFVQTTESAQDSVEQSTFVPAPESDSALQRHTIIGQLHKTYIMLEHPDGLYIVDQHAAHERIIYERLAQRFEDAATIQLLFPIIVSLGADNVAKLMPQLELLQQVGIGIEQLSTTEVVIRATPVQAQNVDYAELVRTVVSWLYEYENFSTEEISRQVNEKLRAQIACKAAVKAGDVLTQEQMEQLLADLNASPNRFSCPHGRPTGWLLGTYEIEKRFRRKQ